MNHIAELKLHQYMTDAVNGKSTMSDEIIHQVADDIKDALQRQFGGKVKRLFGRLLGGKFRGGRGEIVVDLLKKVNRGGGREGRRKMKEEEVRMLSII